MPSAEAVTRADVEAFLGKRPAAQPVARPEPTPEVSREDVAAYLGKTPEQAEGPSAGGALWRNAAHGLTGGGSAKVIGFGTALEGKLRGDPRPFSEIAAEGEKGRLDQIAADQKAYPKLALLADIGGTLAGPLGAIKAGKGIAAGVKYGMGVGGLRGYLESKMQQPGETEQEADARKMGDTVKGIALGGVSGGLGHLITRPVSAAIGWLGNKLLPRAQAFEQAAAGAAGDKASKAAWQTAKSAEGSYGAASAQGFRLLERLDQTAGLPTAEQAANRALLSQPEMQALASAGAAKVREQAPKQLAQIEATKALAEQTAADAAKAYAEGQTIEYAKQDLARHLTGQLKRYTTVLAGGLIGNALGGDEHGPWATMGGMGAGLLAGRGISPMVLALKNTATRPTTQRLIGAAYRSAAEKMAALAQSNPQIAGKFGPILLNARAKGPDAFAAAHYALSQNPEYQALQRTVAEGDQ